MSEKTPEDILNLASQRINARREFERQQQEQHRQQQADKDRHWRYGFLAALGVLIAGLLFTPGLSLDQKMYTVLHGMCSQEHIILLGGIEFPICARCSGIYISALLTTSLLWAFGRGRAAQIPPLPISITLIVAVVLMGIDGVNSMLDGMGARTLYEPFNELRYFTGIGVGIGISTLVFLMINLSLRANPDDQQPVIKNWREFGGILAINILAMVAIYGNMHILAWPLAILAFLGMTGVLYAVNLLLVSLFMGYDGKVSTLAQLARPATIAVVTTLLMILATSSFRYWMEAQGLMPVV